MEDSEKRKEMLKAMRMEAANVAAAENDGSNSIEPSMSTAHLSNPLAETSMDQQESYETTPRFDYYTQPMSAYSSFKRNKTTKEQNISSPSREIRSPVPQFLPSAPGTLGSDYPAHNNHGGFQPGSDYPAHTNHGGFQAPPHYDANNLHTGPRGMTHISPSHRGSPAAWDNNFRPPPVNHFRPPHQAPYPYPFSQEGPDMGNNRYGGRGPDMGNNRYGGRGSYNNTGPQFSHYGQQNSNWDGNRYPGSGRGRGRGRGMNTSFGRDGGRRPMELSAERLYSNSMTEDPWKYLTPVLWKNCSDGSSSSNSTGRTWLPNSIAPREPTMISESSHRPRSNQPSLAEFLAASVDEATSSN